MPLKTALLLLSFLLLSKPVLSQNSTSIRKARMKASPHYKDGVFENLEYTPAFAEGYKPARVMAEFLFKKKDPLRVPKDPIPGVSTDLKNLPADGNSLVWFGHSSYLLSVNGLRILVDPVFSNYASPVRGINKAFSGSNRYSAADLPPIDYVFISHDHYDHLDKATMKALLPNVKKVVCGLGVGAILESWGFAPEQLLEADWNERYPLENGVVLHTLTTRHFSGRGLKRNNTLWMAYLLETSVGKIFIGGDGGYGKHFAEIGAQHGPIDFAIIENGQYNPAWHNIHCLPPETLQAAHDLKARNLMPVHSSKFALALHAWNTPMKELTRLNAESANPLHLVRPQIGEVVSLTDSGKVWKAWWE